MEDEDSESSQVTEAGKLKARTRAQEAQSNSQALLRVAARALTDTGMGMRDAGALLEMTQARVSQLLSE